MIVYDADRLGLSQIYQMRGRVAVRIKLHVPISSTAAAKYFLK